MPWGSDFDYSSAVNCDRCSDVERNIVQDVDETLWQAMASMTFKPINYYIYVSKAFYSKISDSHYFHVHWDYTKKKQGEIKYYYLWFPVNIENLPDGEDFVITDTKLENCNSST